LVIEERRRFATPTTATTATTTSINIRISNVSMLFELVVGQL